MAVSHIAFDRNTTYGRMLASALSRLEEGIEALNDVFSVLNQMKDGDGSQAAHFAYATPLFGFGTDANAKAAYDEINSALSKINTDAQVSSVNAALLQIFAKMR